MFEVGSLLAATLAIFRIQKISFILPQYIRIFQKRTSHIASLSPCTAKRKNMNEKCVSVQDSGGS
jgi:hypothetical protein